MKISFEWSRLEQLSGLQFHEIIAHRERVFVVEQNCPFQDADDYDAHSWHLVGRVDDQFAAYLRVTDAGLKFAEACLGRVLTAKEFRGLSLGKALIHEALNGMDQLYSKQAIRIGAQSYLLKFYGSFGFVVVGDEYLEDGIPHFEMLRPAD
ncbi:MAG TPA: GNAT family N-acetyltransferase [Arenimonas sp.]|nr:GNAT family N-acetyltransferase [Arenimonas sp.]